MGPNVRAPSKLRKWLDDNDIDQAAFARLVGASGASVSRWLGGTLRPGSAMREAIAAATGGAVAGDDWLTAHERSRIARLRAA